MAKSFSSIAELEKYLNKKIKVAMQTEVSETVKDVMQQNVQTEVYDEYTSYSDHPDRYVRREENGGLKDRDNMESTVVNNTLTVENVARMQDTGYKLAGLVEYGNDNGYGRYDYKPARNSKGDFREARPFIEETRKQMEDGLARDSLKKGLQKQGLIIE